MTIPNATERVLSTLNPDGTRRWIRPRLATGPWWRRRRLVAYGLMAVFFLIPYVRFGGKPLVLLDIPRRQFTVLGTTFLPTDATLFLLLFLSLIVGIVLLTALLGRAWCGWACPQTVYLEFLFRPLERLVEGGRGGSLAIDRRGRLAPRRVLLWAIYGLLSLFLAHTFLAYFVGIDQLVHWVRTPPAQHPTAFAVMAITAGAVFLDFAWFREQTCLVACPYGRLQSVLLDRHSLIVGYDARRGEPRAKATKGRAAAAGDCIDCTACVQVCPTGIDIRDGLQMECIHCTQCMDACDAMMDRVGTPRGLVRYSSQARLDGAAGRIVRPRVVLYPAALLVAVGLLLFLVGTRENAEVTVLRGVGLPFTESAEGVLNQVRIRVANRGTAEAAYAIALAGAEAARMIAPENPLRVRAGETRTTTLFVVVPRGAFEGGELHVVFRVSDGARFRTEVPYELVGPDDDREAAGPREARESAR